MCCFFSQFLINKSTKHNISGRPASQPAFIYTLNSCFIYIYQIYYQDIYLFISLRKTISQIVYENSNFGWSASQIFIIAFYIFNILLCVAPQHCLRISITIIYIYIFKDNSELKLAALLFAVGTRSKRIVLLYFNKYSSYIYARLYIQQQHQPVMMNFKII